MTITRKLIQSLACALLVAGAAIAVSGPVFAEQIYVNKLKLTNKGAYVIYKVTMKWKSPTDNKHYSRNEMKLTSKTHGVKMSNPGINGFNTGDVMRVDLDKIHDKRGDKPKPSPGDHVWMIAHIDGGESKSCRKSNHDIYKRGAGYMRAYQVAGTTYNNNRCKRKELIILD